MRIVDSFPRTALRADRPAVCSVGAFDGVHLGHQQLIRAVVNDAHAHQAQSMIVTFFPHPAVVLGRAPPLYLTTPEEKAEQMEWLGIDVLHIIPFDRRVADIAAADFVRWMQDELRMISLWIGPDFAMGKQRRGDASFLMEYGQAHDIRVNILPPMNVGSERISSTRIRTSLARGDIQDVNLCLGRPFRIFARPLDSRRAEVPAIHALPPPGHYSVWVGGVLNHAWLSGGPAPRIIELSDEVEARERMVIEFVE